MKRIKSDKKGTARMLELGYKPIQLWLAPGTHAAIRTLSELNNIPMSTYALQVICEHLAYARANTKG